MGLLILLAVGGILGWLFSIVCAVKDSGAVALYVGVSAAGALLAGLIAAPASILEAISASSVLIGAFGGLVSCSLTHAMRVWLPSNS